MISWKPCFGPLLHGMSGARALAWYLLILAISKDGHVHEVPRPKRQLSLEQQKLIDQCRQEATKREAGKMLMEVLFGRR